MRTVWKSVYDRLGAPLCPHGPGGEGGRVSDPGGGEGRAELCLCRSAYVFARGTAARGAARRSRSGTTRCSISSFARGNRSFWVAARSFCALPAIPGPAGTGTDPVLAGRYYYWLAYTYMFSGSRDDAAQSIQRALEAGQCPGCPDQAWHISSAAGRYVYRALTPGVDHAQSVAFLAQTAPLRRVRVLRLGTSVLLPRALPGGVGRHQRDCGDWSCQLATAAFLQGGGWMQRCGAWQEGLPPVSTLGVCARCLRNRPQLRVFRLCVSGKGRGDPGNSGAGIGSAGSATSIVRNRYKAGSNFSWVSLSVNNQLEQAQDSPCRASNSTSILPWGIGLAQARFAASRTPVALPRQHQSLQQALATFDAMQARYDRTHASRPGFSRPYSREPRHRHNTSEHCLCLVQKTPGAQMGRADGATRSEYGVTLTE